MRLTKFRVESSNPKWNAQRNLDGRTHYVEGDTLRYHKSRISQCVITDNGLLLAIVESYQTADGNRAWRAVVFDVCGSVVKRTDPVKTSKAAERDMWSTLNGIDAIKVTKAAVRAEVKHVRDQANELLQSIGK